MPSTLMYVMLKKDATSQNEYNANHGANNHKLHAVVGLISIHGFCSSIMDAFVNLFYFLLAFKMWSKCFRWAGTGIKECCLVIKVEMWNTVGQYEFYIQSQIKNN